MHEYQDFDEGHIHGLARQRGQTIDILAVIAHPPGKGHFRNWLKVLKARNKRIRFAWVNNTILQLALARAGFKQVEWFDCNEVVQGMKWERE